jgi:hypothetical protein
VGDPTSAGATLTITANGGTSSAQSFDLPAGTSPLRGRPFWSGSVMEGFTYRDTRGENGPLRVARMRKSAAGVFRMEAVAVAKLGAITVVPPDPRHRRLRAARNQRRRHLSRPLRSGRDGHECRFEALPSRDAGDEGHLLTATTTTITSSTSTTSTTAPGVPCEATTGGFCWFLGDLGESCDAACVAAGRTYDSAARSYAGSDGTDENCEAVLTELGVSLTGVHQEGDCTAGWGCLEFEYIPGRHAGMRCVDPAPTVSDAWGHTMRRACACQ